MTMAMTMTMTMRNVLFRDYCNYYNHCNYYIIIMIIMIIQNNLGPSIICCLFSDGM